MALRVLVDFVRVAVVVVGRIAAANQVYGVGGIESVPGNVVGYPLRIFTKFGFRYAIPGLLGALAARKVQKPPGEVLVAVLCAKEVALQLACRAIDHSVASHRRGSTGGGPTLGSP